MCPDAEGNGLEASGFAAISKPQVLRLRAARFAQDDIEREKSGAVPGFVKYRSFDCV